MTLWYTPPTPPVSVVRRDYIGHLWSWRVLVNTAFLALTHTIGNNYLSNEKNTTVPEVNFAFWKTDRLTDPLSN